MSNVVEIWYKLGQLHGILRAEIGEPYSAVVDNDPQVRDRRTSKAREELRQGHYAKGIRMHGNRTQPPKNPSILLFVISRQMEGLQQTPRTKPILSVCPSMLRWFG
jgi:hypothetical protein